MPTDTIDDIAIMQDLENLLRENVVNAAEFATEQVAHAAPFKSGREVGSIFYRIHDDGLGFKIVVGAFYSAFQEFGSKHQPARPFLAPTINANMATILDIAKGGTGE